MTKLKRSKDINKGEGSTKMLQASSVEREVKGHAS